MDQIPDFTWAEFVPFPAYLEASSNRSWCQILEGLTENILKERLKRFNTSTLSTYLALSCFLFPSYYLLLLPDL